MKNSLESMPNQDAVHEQAEKYVKEAVDGVLKDKEIIEKAIQSYEDAEVKKAEDISTLEDAEPDKKNFDGTNSTRKIYENLKDEHDDKMNQLKNSNSVKEAYNTLKTEVMVAVLREHGIETTADEYPEGLSPDEKKLADKIRADYGGKDGIDTSKIIQEAIGGDGSEGDIEKLRELL